MAGRGDEYRVHFEVPGLARGVEVDDDLLVLQAQLLEGDVGAVSPGADVVCVEDDLGGHVDVDVDVKMWK